MFESLSLAMEVSHRLKYYEFVMDVALKFMQMISSAAATAALPLTQVRYGFPGCQETMWL